MRYNKFRYRKRRRRKCKQQKGNGILITLLGVFQIILVLRIKHTHETKKKLCGDEIKCCKKGHTAKWENFRCPL